MKPIDVVLDTSTYRAHPKRNTAAFRALVRLCRAGKLKLHIPEYVRREFVSQQEEGIKADAQKLITAAKSLTRRLDNDEVNTSSDAITRLANEIEKKAKSLSGGEFKEWMVECRAAKLDVHPDHGKRVTDAYFEGTHPFTSVKHREDFPDCFIWQNIVDLASQSERVRVVVNDGALFKSAQTLKNVRGFTTLELFIEDAECQEALAALPSELVANNLTRVRRLISKLIGDEIAFAISGELIPEMLATEIKDENIPAIGVATINDVEIDPDQFKIDEENIEYYGETEIGIPFVTNVECKIDYYASESELSPDQLRAAVGNGVEYRI